MLSEFKKKGRRMMGGNGNSVKMRNRRVVLLLLALSAAVLGVTLLHKLREGRVYGLLLQDRDRQVIALQLVLQRETKKWREMRRNLEDRRAKISILKDQKMELANKLSESKEMVDHLHRTQDKMEAALSEKQNQINMLSARTQESTMTTSLQVTALTETLKQKEAQVEEMKQLLMNPTAQDGSMGKWVNFQTNADPEGEVSEDPQNQKPSISSQENDNPEEGHEVSQVSTSEIKEPSEDEVSQVRPPTEIQEQNEEPTNDQGKLEKLDRSRDSNEKQGDATRTRHGRRNKRRTRRRRKSTSRVRDLERKREKNEQDGEQNGTVTTVPDESPVDEGSKTESQSNSTEERPGDTNQQLPVDDEGLKTNSEVKREDDSSQQASSTENQEGAGSVTESDTAVPHDTPSEEDARNQGGGEGDGDNRITREEDGKEVATPAEGKADQEPESLVDDAKNNSSDEKVVDTADFIQDTESGVEKQDEAVKEEEGDAKAASNMEQAEVQNGGDDRQSQTSETTIDTTGESSAGDSKEAQGLELTDNAVNQNSGNRPI